MKIPSIHSEKLSTGYNGQKRDSDFESQTKPPISMVIVFAFAFIIALLLKLASEHWMPDGVFRVLSDHVSIAIIVASVLGITYDFVLNYQREEAINNIIKQFKNKFDDHEEVILEHLKAYALFTPKDVFDLLQDIASQTTSTPTLYEAAREEPKEYTFAKSIHYFDKLVTVQRKVIIELLREWIQKSDHPNVKFLASDFIGKYRLYELSKDLYDEASRRLGDNIPESIKDRAWILNYIWAYSRCEEPMYETLKDLLCSTKEEWIKEWILAVPIQMPDQRFIEILSAYLECDKEISVQNRKKVLKALASMQQNGKYNVEKLFKQHGYLFDNVELLNYIDNIWCSKGISPLNIKNIIILQRNDLHLNKKKDFLEMSQ